MISIKIDPRSVAQINKTVEKQVVGMKQINNQKNRTELSKAIFTITGKAFLKSTSARAAAGSELSHMYEWGSTTKKLFLLRRQSVSGGNLTVSTKYLQSNKPVPIKPELKVPGPSGKTVRAKNIFRNKAEVIEEGKRVVIIPKKTIVFPVDGKLVFVPPGHTVVVNNPGGRAAKNAFAKHMQTWYAKNGASTVDQSRIIPRIEKGVAGVLNRPGFRSFEISEVISSICMQYSKGLTVL